MPPSQSINGLADTPFWTSTEALFAKKLPTHLGVIGASVVALEIAQAYRRLGSEVTIIARLTLLCKEDPLLGEKLTQGFKKDGIRVLNDTQVARVHHNGELFQLETNSGRLTCDQLLISTGRHANTATLKPAAAAGESYLCDRVR